MNRLIITVMLLLFLQSSNVHAQLPADDFETVICDRHYRIAIIHSDTMPNHWDMSGMVLNDAQSAEICMFDALVKPGNYIYQPDSNMLTINNISGFHCDESLNVGMWLIRSDGTRVQGDVAVRMAPDSQSRMCGLSGEIIIPVPIFPTCEEREFIRLGTIYEVVQLEGGRCIERPKIRS